MKTIGLLNQIEVVAIISYTLISTSFSSPSATANAPLTPEHPPAVELIRFYAYAEKAQNTIIWESASEHSLSYYVIERSTNPDSNYEQIGWKTAVGNSIVPIKYSFYDTILCDSVFYRILAYDNQNCKIQSKPIMLNRMNYELKINQLIPTKSKEEIYISYNSPANALIEMLMFNQFTEVVYHKVFETERGPNFIRLDLTLIPSGSYVIELRNRTDVAVEYFRKE